MSILYRVVVCAIVCSSSSEAPRHNRRYMLSVLLQELVDQCHWPKWQPHRNSPLILSYHPISAFLALSNLIWTKPFINWSASWSSVPMAWTRISLSSTYCQKKCYGIAICLVRGFIFGIIANCRHALLSSCTIVGASLTFPNDPSDLAKKVYLLGVLDPVTTVA